MIIEAIATSTLLALATVGTEIDHPVLDNLHGAAAEHLRAARDGYQRLAANATPDEVGMLAGRLAETYLAHNLTDSAISALEVAHAHTPREPRWTYLLGHAIKLDGDLERAASLFEAVLALEPDLVFVRTRYADTLLGLNRLDEAEAIFSDLAALENSNTAFATAALGRIAYMRRDYEGAIVHLERALELSPGSDQLHHTLAMAYRGVGDVEAAREHIRLKGDVSVSIVDPIVRDVMAKNRSVQYHVQRGRALMDRGQVEMAITALKEAVELAPEDENARVTLGLAYERAGLADQARSTFEEVLNAFPNSAPAHHRMGMILRRAGQLEEALPYFRNALEILPHYLEAGYRLGVTLMDLDRPLEAYEAYVHLAEVRPDNVFVQIQAITALLAGGDCDRAGPAIIELRNSARARPDVALVTVRGMSTCRRVPQRLKAQSLRLAEELYGAQSNLMHHEALAMALAGVGRYEDAAREQRELIAQTDPDQHRDWLPILRADLSRYESGQPAALPYAPGHPQRTPDAGQSDDE